MKRYGVLLKKRNNVACGALCGYTGYPLCKDDDNNFGTDNINIAFELANILSISNKNCEYEVVDKYCYKEL